MALLNFQEKSDTKATVLVFMVYSSGRVSSVMMISQMIEINEIDSSRSPSIFIMMRLILPVYLTNSWRSKLSLAMWPPVHSLAMFKL